MVTKYKYCSTKSDHIKFRSEYSRCLRSCFWRRRRWWRSYLVPGTCPQCSLRHLWKLLHPAELRWPWAAVGREQWRRCRLLCSRPETWTTSLPFPLHHTLSLNERSQRPNSTKTMLWKNSCYIIMSVSAIGMTTCERKWRHLSGLTVSYLEQMEHKSMNQHRFSLIADSSFVHSLKSRNLQ